MDIPEQELPANIRKSLRELLRILTVPENLRKLVGGIGEAYCMWFDDLYLPNDPIFRSVFSSKTLDAFDRVNSALESCREFVDGRDLETILKAKSWQEVQSAAHQAISIVETT
jgi:hypothetical protein